MQFFNRLLWTYMIIRVYLQTGYNQMNNKNSKILTSPVKAEQIIQYCRQKYINILPNSNARHTSSTSQSLSNAQCKISSLNTIMYKKQEVKEVMRQLSIFLQLIIQNCLLSSDSKIKTQSYKILGNFRNLLSRDLDDFQTLIYNKNKNKLPFYEVDCKQFLRRELVFKMPPQVSLYQDPLLFYIYTRVAQEQLFVNHSIHLTRDQRIQILKKHTPFLDPLFIPIIQQRLQTKAKFSELQDRMLLILVASHRQVSQVKNIYLPNRPEDQIKNRIKNLCKMGKQIINSIKQSKLNQFIPLKPQQIQKVVQGFNRFSNRWPVISKYYCVRCPSMLQADYNDCDKLKKRRSKQKVKSQYDSLKKIVQEKIEQLNKQCKEIQIIQQEPEAVQLQKNQDLQSMQEEEEIQPQYKIINHLTFQYQEI